MAVPFSNTSLRVPRGFGNILEGLAREVLRDQPADIPSFAAGYFTALLQKRQESGLDPAEWGTQLEDRFYNNNAFRTSTNLLVEPQSDMLEMKADYDSGEFSYSTDICAQELSTKEQTPRHEERISYFEEENDTAGNEICASERTPTAKSTHHGLADVDVCGEELQSGLSVKEHNEVSESPIPFLVEDGSRGVLDKNDEFIHPGEVSTADKDDAQEPHDADETETTTVDEESEMNAALVDKVESDKPAEINDRSISESFDETSADEVSGVEIQGVEDIWPETEDLNESSNCDNANAETEHFKNTTFEVNTADDAIYEDQEESLDRSTDPQDPDDPMETREGHQQDGTSTSRDVAGFDETFETFGSLNEAGIKEDLSSHSVPTQVPRRASKELASDETNDPNETQINEEQLLRSLSAQDSTPASPRPRSEESDEEHTGLKDNTDSGGASHVPTAYDTQEDTEATYEECTVDQDYKESGPREDISHEGMLENQDKELQKQEHSSQAQEEEDIMDIPLDDPEANKAAAKIQAGFRGHMTRKKLKPDEKPGEEVSSTGEALNGSQGDAAGGSEGVETDDTSVPEQ